MPDQTNEVVKCWFECGCEMRLSEGMSKIASLPEEPIRCPMHGAKSVRFYFPMRRRNFGKEAFETWTNRKSTLSTDREWCDGTVLKVANRAADSAIDAAKEIVLDLHVKATERELMAALDGLKTGGVR